MTRRLRDKVERLARAVSAIQAEADLDLPAVERWAELYLAVSCRDEDDAPTAERRAAAEAFAEAFVADCNARGVTPTWIELMKLAGEN